MKISPETYTELEMCGLSGVKPDENWFIAVQLQQTY